MNRKTINHQINLGLIRQTQFGLTYEESNKAFFIELCHRTRENEETIIYFQDRKVMEDFQNSLKNPEIQFYSHPKVSIITTRYREKKA